jgi:hypothetical protein
VSDDDPSRRSKPRRRWLRWSAAALVLAVFAGLTGRLFVWPDLAPPPSRVDAIVELAGFVNRDEAALALAREHRAPVLLQSTLVRDPGTDRCLPPVPGVTIGCFQPDPNTTQGEARFIGQMAQREHWHSVILVTTPDHAWRAKLRVSRCFSGDVYVVTTPLPWWGWFRAIPYQWVATVKALTVERDC